MPVSRLGEAWGRGEALESLGVRHPLVLSQVLNPRSDKERFQESSFFRGVFEDIPSVCAVAPPQLSQGPDRG